MTYVVCQTPRCQQTYPIDSLGVITEHTKNINCKKCGGVLIDEYGRANFSRNAAVRPVVDMAALEKYQKQDLKDKREQMKTLQEEIRELEELGY